MANPPAKSSGQLLRVGVIGCGRMGRLHARVYSQMPRVEVVGVFDTSADAAAALAEEFALPAASSLNQLLETANAVSTAVAARGFSSSSRPSPPCR